MTANRNAEIAEKYAKACPGGIDGPLNGAVINIVDTAKIVRYRIAESFDIEPKNVPVELCFTVAIEALSRAEL